MSRAGCEFLELSFRGVCLAVIENSTVFEIVCSDPPTDSRTVGTEGTTVMLATYHCGIVARWRVALTVIVTAPTSNSSVPLKGAIMEVASRYLYKKTGWGIGLSVIG